MTLIDVPSMSILDPDTSAFTTMLLKIGSWNRQEIAAGRLREYDWVNKDGKQWVVLQIKRKAPDDWFSDEMVAVIARPWNEPLFSKGRVAWMEDDLMPRVMKAHQEAIERTFFFGSRA